MEEHAPFVCFSIESVPGKGNGWIAGTDIPKGCRLLEEAAVFVIELPGRSLEQLHLELGQFLKKDTLANKRIFLSLANAFPGKKAILANILATNAFTRGDFKYVAPISARLNHSCQPNAYLAINHHTDTLTITALETIGKGEEITISYLEDLFASNVRQMVLQKKYNFHCACPLCRLDQDEELAKKLLQKKYARWVEIFGHQDFRNPVWFSDMIMAKVYDFNKSLTREATIADPVTALRTAEKMFALVRAEMVLEPILLAKTVHEAFKIVMTHSDLARGKKFARFAFRKWRECEGPDGTNTILWRGYAANPASAPNMMVTGRWMTALEDGPGDVGKNERAKWLWRHDLTGGI
ncbi:hypothetical protein MMC24_005824 [Lignoscripta atroalba]|nr:hypothetical protein [Lignoscripta atroalba]